MTVLGWLECETAKGSCLVRGINYEGALMVPFEVFRKDKALEVAQKFWGKNLIWLESNPWTNKDFVSAVKKYEQYHGCSLDGYVPQEKKAW